MAINLDHVTEQITVTDTATNASLTVQPKGTGAFNIAAGSSGLNLSNGGTVTAVTKVADGANYTTLPTVAIAAPTTAGGVQAVLQLYMYQVPNTVAFGGTGYTVGNTLTVVGGTPVSSPTVLTVTSVSSGVITGVARTDFNAYTALPTNPVSVTGGSGSGATFNLVWGVGSIIITNAGSGYVEQPSITFSGGGGSGAAAYAGVGGIATIKALASNVASLQFATPGGVAFSVADTNRATVDYWEVIGSTGAVGLRVAGATGNNNGIITSKGSGYLSLQTNGFNSEALRATYTASSVNYVNATGAPTGSSPVISAQGSDSNIQIQLQAKGTGLVRFTTGGGLQAYVSDTVSAVNYHQFTGSATGFGPVHTVAGSDTNIPLVLQPKGTGALQAQQTDSTATGGNARGANAVDFQTLRDTSIKVASGLASVVAGGQANYASSFWGVVSGGYNNANIAFGGALAGGYQNLTAGNYSVSSGGRFNTSGGSAFMVGSVSVGGISNSSLGTYNFIGGGFTNSGTSSSAVTTQSATMNGTTAVTLSGSNASIKVGQYISGTSIGDDTYVAAISGTSLTLSKVASGSSTSTLSFFTPHGVVVGGGNNQATGSYSFVGGGGDAGNAANRNVANGDWSFIGGGAQNNASGANSSVLGGANCSSTSAFSVCLGGAGNSSSGFGSTNLGGNGNVANGTYSVASGFSSTNRSLSTFAYAAGTASRNGDAQTEIFVLRNSTTDATATVLTLGAGAASTTNQVILPNNSAYFFTGEVVAGVTGGGNTKGWTIEGVIKRGANAASTALVGTPMVTSAYADVGAATWAIAVTADTTNGGLAVTFTGQLATTIRVVAQIRTTEMTF